MPIFKKYTLKYLWGSDHDLFILSLNVSGEEERKKVRWEGMQKKMEGKMQQYVNLGIKYTTVLCTFLSFHLICRLETTSKIKLCFSKTLLEENRGEYLYHLASSQVILKCNSKYETHKENIDKMS